MDTTDAAQRSGDRDRGGSDLTNRLLAQIPADRAGDFWSVGDYGDGGIVVSGAGSLTAVSRRTQGMTWPLLVDRRRYAGSNRPRGTVKFDPSWIGIQRDLNTATVLTDSGYVGEGDHEALVAILEQTMRAGANVTAVLPLHISWLADPGVKFLISEVNQREVPVALVLERAADPLGTQYAVNGLKHLLSQAQASVGLLCTDISGLGAIAYGASWAAVGVTSALRHLYPVDKKGPPGGQQRTRHAIVPRLMTFMNVERIAEGWAHVQRHDDLDESLWRCDCVECGNRTMDRFVTCTDLSLAAHNICVLDDLHQQVTTPDSWKWAISNALGWYLRIHDEFHITWESPAFMNAWLPRSQR
ncbi:hypothetical protein Acor_74700 [Acrocarpospora corrugata]|uniref:tRNA-guanine(15) transglycosylase-like domain-containing protein n=1 Tax=Acrocarpospora corrugata TaxID=35763 RepID=A0A5M3WBI8_9ACTN|nr:hypothetical protein [Acrocarpospora corrugata]GES05402.1 hypothetical protein Acor_74700 [Acrocarpospora corrugata]